MAETEEAIKSLLSGKGAHAGGKSPGFDQTI